MISSRSLLLINALLYLCIDRSICCPRFIRTFRILSRIIITTIYDSDSIYLFTCHTCFDVNLQFLLMRDKRLHIHTNRQCQSSQIIISPFHTFIAGRIPCQFKRLPGGCRDLI